MYIVEREDTETCTMFKRVGTFNFVPNEWPWQNFCYTIYAINNEDLAFLKLADNHRHLFRTIDEIKVHAECRNGKIFNLRCCNESPDN